MAEVVEFVASREIDGGRGVQEILVIDGKVVEQHTESKSSGYYEGFGQDELVGKEYKSLRGWGFRKMVHLPDEWSMYWRYFDADQ